MPKKEYLISVTILVVYIILCCYINRGNLEVSSISTNDIIIKNHKPKELPIAKVKIPRLNINHDIYDLNSSYNNVEKNVTLLDGSILPNKKNSIIFLAAHSGNSKISYFNHLNKIKPKEKVTFYYDNYKYIYQVINIKEENKNGYIKINKRKENQLILTTCSTNNKEKQLIVESMLIKKEKYHNL